ncbi:hypothetical protein CROQUDRAFT_669477 [Cronartium quercuum f. sp. fusiforme G11]|uniref:Mitochondrial proton/calcium exchanger protein n=1 Tax=Cronartium quercuum f. sp. fusiforme G11 TaxID=708437 RepID=A0A9P6TE40_9BASI|nr:hypothetical protein CROQUDRAFT_669477 [Cronartium quercuum f. sp. fusiforme G11]
MSALCSRRLPPLAIYRTHSYLPNQRQSLAPFQSRLRLHTQPSYLDRPHHFCPPLSLLSPSGLLQSRLQINPLALVTRLNSSSAGPEKDDGSQKALSRPPASDQTHMQRIWAKVKSEASHYWHGTKLLGKEIRLSAKYQMKLLRGKKLTRREKRQLKRTTTDLLRLIPFSVFLIVPFMELLLPVALRLFPNMLPSTFRDESKELEKKRKLLKVRLEMAKFLQETLRETGMSKRVKETEEFKEFFRKVRSTGEKPSMDDVVKVARLFEDDLTLDNLSRPQLVSMCRYMNINAFGTDNFLRYTIRNRMRHLAADDALIDAEGIESLSATELRHACQSRGIRSMGVDEAELRKELEQWIDLHLHRGLSATLLILGRAFAFNRGGDTEKGDSTLESLKDALSSLPDTLLNEAELEVSQDTVTNKQRLAVLEEQEELIADESEQEQREEEARKAQRELERSQKAEAEELEKMEKVVEVAKDMVPEVKSDSEPAVDPDSVKMTSEQLHELGEALSILSAKSSVLKEKTELKKLVEENREAAQEPDNTASAGLVKSIQKMIHEIDTQLEEYDTQVGNRMHQINIGQDGKISVGDLRKGLAAIKHRPSDDAIEVLIDKLDIDHDGFVPLDHVVSLAAEEGLGIVVDEDSSSNVIISEGQKLRHNELQSKARDAQSKGEVSAPGKEDPKPKKSDIVEDP